MSLSLKKLLRTWSQSAVFLRSVQVTESEVEKVSQKIGLSETSRPLQTEIPRLRRKIAEAAEVYDFTNLTSRDWAYAPFALDGPEGILFTPDLLERFLNSSREHLRPRLLRSLARVYIETFSNKQHTRQLSDFLLENRRNLGRRWNEWHEAYAVLSPNKLVQRLTDLCLKSEGASRQHLSSIFEHVMLPTWFAASNALMLPVIKEVFFRITKGMTSLSEQDASQIINFSEYDNNNLILGASNEFIGIMAEALLVPLSHSMPNTPVCNIVQGHLLRHLKDPRIFPAKWSSVRSDVKEIIYRWLTKQSLDLFLNIVDEVVNTSTDAKRMWQNRKLLWGSYLKAGYIDEAWVVLGREGCAYAKALEIKEQSLKLSYAELIYSSDISKHIALMLRVDSLTIVDWSHNGRCHIWTSEAINHPKLYMREYSKSQLERGSRYSFTHSAGGSWMHDVKAIIYNETGRSTKF